MLTVSLAGADGAASTPVRNAFVAPVQSVVPMGRKATLSPSVAALPPKVMAVEAPW